MKKSTISCMMSSVLLLCACNTGTLPETKEPKQLPSQLITATSNPSGSTSTVTESFEYDSLNRMTTYNYVQGEQKFSVEFEYSEDHKLIGARMFADKTPASKFEYLYDQPNAVVVKLDDILNKEKSELYMTLDDKGRLINYGPKDARDTFTYTYDNLGNLETVTLYGVTTTYTISKTKSAFRHVNMPLWFPMLCLNQFNTVNMYEKSITPYTVKDEEGNVTGTYTDTENVEFETDTWGYVLSLTNTFSTDQPGGEKEKKALCTFSYTPVKDIPADETTK